MKKILILSLLILTIFGCQKATRPIAEVDQDGKSVSELKVNLNKN